MKKPPAMGTPEASINNHNNSTSIVVDRETSAQASNSQRIQIAHIGAIWKSPRDKSTCIQGALKTYKSHPYFDLRLFELDQSGRMQATDKGITISPQRLMQLSKLVGDAARMAARLGLIPGSSA